MGNDGFWPISDRRDRRRSQNRRWKNGPVGLVFSAREPL